jgi:hypothetical protein
MMVSQLVEGRRRPPQRVLVLPELIVRNSSGVPRGGPWEPPFSEPTGGIRFPE